MKKKTNVPVRKSNKVSAANPVITVTRGIKPFTRLLLFVRAGGRCEFNGCNEYLLEHALTITPGNFAEMAHVVAFQELGPRGNAPRPRDINDVSNLMLMCPRCHKLIDDNPDRYSVKTLEKYKESHEDRIHHVTALGPDMKTTVVQLKARIGQHSVAIPIAQVTHAVAPRYPTDARGCVIDLTSIEAPDAEFVNAAKHSIDQKLKRLYDNGMDVAETRHISLFALAPMPLLVYLGSQMSNKVPVDVFQRHRDTEDWVWKEDGTAVDFAFTKVREGTERKCVALVLSLSGKIDLDTLPDVINGRFHVYEMSLATGSPSPTFLRMRQDIVNFKVRYQEALRCIARDHGQIGELHVFPAVPAPIAVLCGREILPKTDPKLLIYDYDKALKGFNLILTVN